ADRAHVVAALAIGRARLDLLVRERLEAVGLVLRRIERELMAADREAVVGREMGAVVLVEPQLDAALGLAGERLRDDVDHAGGGLRAVEDALPAVKDLDPL